MEVFQLKVISTLVGVDAVVSEQRKKIDVNLAGVIGDRHFGHSKKAGVREKKFHENGDLIFNGRQWSAVYQGELAEIAAGMGVPEIKPEWLGANLFLGSEHSGSDFCFTKMPPMTRMVFSSGATLLVYGENLPCKFPAQVMQEAEPDIFDGKSQLFAKSAIGKRGVVGWVEKSGEICPGDIVRVYKP